MRPVPLKMTGLFSFQMTTTAPQLHSDTYKLRLNGSIKVRHKALNDVLDIFQETIWICFAQEPRDNWGNSTDEEEEHKSWKKLLVQLFKSGVQHIRLRHMFVSEEKKKNEKERKRTNRFVLWKTEDQVQSHLRSSLKIGCKLGQRSVPHWSITS